MRVKDAQAELEQYIKTQEYDCPGSQWGYCHRHYSDVNGPVTSRTWTPTWGTYDRIVRTSLQLCIAGIKTFPTPQAYAAQVNWSRAIRRALTSEPTWRTDTWPAPRYHAKPQYPGIPTEHGLGVKFIAALRATGPDWERDAMPETWKPKSKVKRARKAKA